MELFQSLEHDTALLFLYMSLLLYELGIPTLLHVGMDCGSLDKYQNPYIVDLGNPQAKLYMHNPYLFSLAL